PIDAVEFSRVLQGATREDRVAAERSGERQTEEVRLPADRESVGREGANDRGDRNADIATDDGEAARRQLERVPRAESVPDDQPPVGLQADFPEGNPSRREREARTGGPAGGPVQGDAIDAPADGLRDMEVNRPVLHLEAVDRIARRAHPQGGGNEVLG